MSLYRNKHTSQMPTHYDPRNYRYQIEMSRAYSMNHDDITSPPQDIGGDSTEEAPRRRIAVACARCRKRKIKCSGDPGDGKGCDNCRSANAGACNFYRVGSEEVVHAMLQRGDYLPGYAPESPAYDAYANSPARLYSSQYPRNVQSDLATTGASRSMHGADWSYGFDTDTSLDAYNAQTSGAYMSQERYSALYSQYSSQNWSTYARTANPATSMHYHNGTAMSSIDPTHYSSGLISSSYAQAMQNNRHLPAPATSLRTAIGSDSPAGYARNYYAYAEHGRASQPRQAMSLVGPTHGYLTTEASNQRSGPGGMPATDSAAMVDAANALTRYASSNSEHDSSLSHQDSPGDIAYTFTPESMNSLEDHDSNCSKEKSRSKHKHRVNGRGHWKSRKDSAYQGSQTSDDGSSRR